MGYKEKKIKTYGRKTKMQIVLVSFVFVIIRVKIDTIVLCISRKNEMKQSIIVQLKTT